MWECGREFGGLRLRGVGVGFQMEVTLDRPLLPKAPPPQASGAHVLLAVAGRVGRKDYRGISASWELRELAGPSALAPWLRTALVHWALDASLP